MRIGDCEYYKSVYNTLDGKKKVERGFSPECDGCPFGWDSFSYEGECEDCGCYINKDFDVPIIVCMLPHWIKRIIKKRW